MQNETTELRNQVRTLKRIVCLVCCVYGVFMFAGCTYHSEKGLGLNIRHCPECGSVQKCGCRVGFTRTDTFYFSEVEEPNDDDPNNQPVEPSSYVDPFIVFDDGGEEPTVKER